MAEISTPMETDLNKNIYYFSYLNNINRALVASQWLLQCSWKLWLRNQYFFNLQKPIFSLFIFFFKTYQYLESNPH